MKKLLFFLLILACYQSRAQHSARDTGTVYIDGERISGGKTSRPPTAILRGFVYDRSSAEPVVFSLVYLGGTSIGVQTDINGFFSLTKVPPGTYHLGVSALSYDALDTLVRLDSGQYKTMQLFLRQDTSAKTGSNFRTSPPGDIKRIDLKTDTAAIGGLAKVEEGFGPPVKTVSREDIGKLPIRSDGERYRPLKPYKWWQWRKKRRLHKQLQQAI